MKHLLTRVASSALLIASLAGASLAQVTKTFTPNPADLNDLDHHSIYTWKVTGANTSSQLNLTNTNYISAASLTIKNISNWTDEPNKLFAHLFDTAHFSGVHSFLDDDPNLNTVSGDIRDDFTSGRFPNAQGKDASGASATWLIDANTQQVGLFAQSFTTTGHDYTFNFDTNQLFALETYIRNNGDFALGLDPDCHFNNDGVSLSVTTSFGSKLNGRVPEPATGLLLLAGLGALCVRRRKV